MSGMPDDVVYHGTKTGSGAVITVETLRGEMLGVVNHHPNGISWGYGGSGPKDCAWALLTAALARDDDWWNEYGGPKVARYFKDEIVAGLPDEWWMSRSAILAWLDERRA